MPYSEMLRRVAFVTTDVSEEHSTSIIRVTRISELGTTLAVTSNRHTLHAHLVSVRRARRLLVTANVVPSSLIVVTVTRHRCRSLHGKE
jgi:hypothetical protein